MKLLIQDNSYIIGINIPFKAQEILNISFQKNQNQIISGHFYKRIKEYFVKRKLFNEIK